MTGNPGMATGGMGDVLGGLIAGFLAQGIGAYDAVRAAVFLHGMVADGAECSLSQRGLLAGDVLVITDTPHNNAPAITLTILLALTAF